jgi:hypothetical protein
MNPKIVRNSFGILFIVGENRTYMPNARNRAATVYPMMVMMSGNEFLLNMPVQFTF